MPSSAFHILFKFWLSHANVKEVVQGAWRTAHTDSPWVRVFGGFLEIRDKLCTNRIKTMLVTYLRTQGSWKNKSKSCRKKISGVPALILISTMAISHNISDYNRILKLQEVYWQQKSRSRWLQEGDSNMSFFNRSVVLRRRNMINSIKKNDGSATVEESEINSTILNFFRQQWNEHLQTIMLELPSLHSKLSTYQNNILNYWREASVDEIIEASSQLHSDQAPEPNGFQTLFCKCFWYIANEDVIVAILDAFKEMKMPDGLLIGSAC